mgnify:CR=1 FL=1
MYIDSHWVEIAGCIWRYVSTDTQMLILIIVLIELHEKMQVCDKKCSNHSGKKLCYS